ncbi:MAG: sporulation peptidase YabG [Clostridiaceae bacterium]|nr:sporulation peptidase YabG [Clostridiaceae bacterium]
MENLKIGDIVARKSYGYDIFFKVVDINNDGKESIITLKGITYRIQADAPASDLVVQPEAKVREYRNKVDIECYKKLRNTNYFQRPVAWSKKSLSRNTSKDNTRSFKKSGKILHLDGDEEYLKRCIDEYKKYNLDIVGKHLAEKDQPTHIYRLLREYKPDILVITGHDSLSKDKNDYTNVNNYKNSKYFIETVKEARRYNPDMDSLLIFAGACQSMYDGLLKAGANFASSPERVLIHALDPVLVAEKLANTTVNVILNPLDVINSTITKEKGIGGFQTRGVLRRGYPRESLVNP